MSTVGLDEDEIRKYVRRQLEKDWFADQLDRITYFGPFRVRRFGLR